jgi:hypothetical protein
MSYELSQSDWSRLDAVEPSNFLYFSETCTGFILSPLLTEPGTLTIFGGTTLLGEPITDQSDNPLLT